MVSCFLTEHCNYPGTIDNGTILLIGVIGKFVFRHYVRNIKHNDRIEFKCVKYFRLNGTTGATCVDGEWHPPAITTGKCIQKNFPTDTFAVRAKESFGTSALMLKWTGGP